MPGEGGLLGSECTPGAEAHEQEGRDRSLEW